MGLYSNMTWFNNLSAFNSFPLINHDSGDEMSSKSFEEDMKKKLLASNDPKPTHCVELSSPKLLTPEFDKKRAKILYRFQKYQETIDNYHKSHK